MEEVANTLALIMMSLVMLLVSLAILGFLIAGATFLLKEWWEWMKGIWRS